MHHAYEGNVNVNQQHMLACMHAQHMHGTPPLPPRRADPLVALPHRYCIVYNRIEHVPANVHVANVNATAVDRQSIANKFKANHAYGTDYNTYAQACV